MIRIQKAIPLEVYRLRITFNSGAEGVFDMAPWISRPAFASLRNVQVFRHVMLDDVAGTICWSNGIDMCPDIIYAHTEFPHDTYPRKGFKTMKKTELSHDDRQRLYEELNKLPIWQDGGTMGEKSVLRAAGFPDSLVGQIMLTGTSAIDTPNLFSHLQGFGHLTTKPTHTALGALVEYLAHNTSDLDSQRFLEGLIKKYHLIDEQE